MFFETHPRQSQSHEERGRLSGFVHVDTRAKETRVYGEKHILAVKTECQL